MGTKNQKIIIGVVGTTIMIGLSFMIHTGIIPLISSIVWCVVGWVTLLLVTKKN